MHAQDTTRVAVYRHGCKGKMNEYLCRCGTYESHQEIYACVRKRREVAITSANDKEQGLTDMLES